MEEIDSLIAPLLAEVTGVIVLLAYPLTESNRTKLLAPAEIGPAVEIYDIRTILPSTNFLPKRPSPKYIS